MFLWSAIQATGQATTPLVGAALGLATAVVLGYLLYRRSVTSTCDVLHRHRCRPRARRGRRASYGLHDLQEGGVLPGIGSLAFDVRDSVPLDSWYGALLHGIFGFTPDSTWLQTVAFLAYLAVVLQLFFRRPAPARRPAAAPTRQPVDAR